MIYRRLASYPLGYLTGYPQVYPTRVLDAARHLP